MQKFSNQEKELLDRLDNINDIEKHLNNLLLKSKINVERLEKIDQDIKRIINEKTKGLPWLAEAIAKYEEVRDIEVAKHLENKKHPAQKAADNIKRIAVEKRVLSKQANITKYRIRLYESLFPWLLEYVDEDLDDLLKAVENQKKIIESDDDPVKFYLPKGEYEKLSPLERNQKAMYRYWTKKKSKWEIGRDYERYIGYLYEKEGYKVYYQGIEDGLEDLGRDLIANNDKEIRVIQCKNWSHYKKIHEKHVAQLFGTTIKCRIEQRKNGNKIKESNIKGVFATSTLLSETATEFAKELGVEVKENLKFERYPCIKCNISRKNGEKIYHLPIDQQYDKVKVEEEKNECYVETVAEAEEKGYRRAWRWRGNK